MTIKEITEKLWNEFCNYSRELDGEMPDEYYGGATTMLEWILMEFPVIEKEVSKKGHEDESSN